MSKLLFFGGYALNYVLLLRISDSIRFAIYFTPELPLLLVPLLLVDHLVVIRPHRLWSLLWGQLLATHQLPQPLASPLLLKRLVLVLLGLQPSLAARH